MDSGNQQRILGYFIEEAKEHLDTLEKGLLNLREVAKDPETVNEMFRAAHSVKGGAAMLGFSSLQKTAHRLEDGLKILKEHPIEVDRNLENLFLQGYDTLKALLDQLQGPFGLREEEAEQALQAAEPHFVKLQAHLESLISDGSPPATAAPSPEPSKAAGKVSPKFASQVMGILKQMLQLFKQKDTPASRQKLQENCQHLAKLGQGVQSWQGLVRVASKAIANSQNSYPTLAPILIKDLKNASDLLQGGKGSTLTVSPTLQKLASTPPATSPPASKATPKQITITVEPKAAAQAIVKAFDKKQLTQLAKLLVQAARASS
ncbi:MULTISPECIES: Hpt domain-containing protein [unclassified Coleofasciculus]|uniref:Hpt domain-containing protein n=1 Tax=unclassified Coleofasciculus TaxID=2692782 RepID=UPI00188220BF|nr:MULTISPECIES: Hpt domain-containing protein [unclassified Coleofasciculus]MBE9127576.1 Hpt domain-containing protein [Coleofasciculus sp. LEGE 07081]MBE9149793.1 Hpt domain-containing protein [Coleofasciculus sp. LEGE 07092]